jgi:hypothetical protein
LSSVSSEAVYSGVLTSSISLTAAAKYYCVIKLVSTVGDENNYVYVRIIPGVTGIDFMTPHWLIGRTAIYIAGLVYESYINQTSVGTSQTIYGNTRVGQTIIAAKRLNVSSVKFYVSKTGSPQNLVLDVYAVDPNTLKPMGAALATLETPAANIGTSLAWVEFNISYALQKDTYYAFVLYQKNNGGDSSNYYTVQYATSNPIQGNMVTSSDAGATWTVSSSNDLGIVVMTPTEALIWQKTISLSEYSSRIAATTFRMRIRYRSIDGRFVTLRILINDVEYSDAGSAYNGILFLTDTVIPESKTYGDASITVKLYGSGNGLVNMLSYVRCFYFNSKRITPVDFGVSEMVLWDGALDPGTVIMFDDNPLQFISNPEDAPDTLYFDMSEAPREVLVRSLTVSKGRADISFLGW